MTIRARSQIRGQSNLLSKYSYVRMTRHGRYHSTRTVIRRGARMRMISRRENEGVVIGDNIYVTVLDIHEDHVRLAISSPNDLPSYREETLYWEEADEPRELQLQ